MEYATDRLAPSASPARRLRALWPGLLLGALLMMFVASFVYAAYVLADWGQETAAQIPDMPPLALPKLVRQAPSNASADEGPVLAFNQPAPNTAREERPVAASGRVTVLLMGVDNRPGQQVSRTDSIMVITMNPQDGSMGLFSLPRDLLVTIPGFGDEVKINMVHVLGEIRQYQGGGPQLLKETVSDLTGYPVDYYVRMNFEGFRQVIDLLGGIEIDVPREIRDDAYPDDNYGYDPLYIPAGRQTLDGATALKYARTRHADSDYQRAGRQQQVLMAVRDKLMQPGQLAALLPRLPGLAIATANTVQTDMPVEKAVALARAVGDLDMQEPQRVVIDGTMGTTSLHPDLGYVLTPDMAKLRAAADRLFAEPETEAVAEDTARAAIIAEAARVVVLNGSPQEGLAAATAADLNELGFTVTAVGNADRSDYAGNWLVTNGDTKPLTVEALARFYNIPPDHIRSEPPSEGADVTLIIGGEPPTETAAS
jgi:LCP family protein required for cell wall assembly